MNTEQTPHLAPSDSAEQTGAQAHGWLVTRVRDEAHKIKHEFLDYRRQAIGASPDWFIKHSSNVFGLIQVASEILMFKANGTKFLSESSKGKPFRYVIDPPVNIFRNIFRTGKSQFKLEELKSPEFYKSLINIEEATKRDLAKLTPRDVANGQGLFNRWQARSSACGLAGMAQATLVPERKDTPEEIARDEELFKTNKLGYAGHRLKQALNPFGWADDKREFTGMSIALAGVFSFLSGFRNVRTVGKTQQYFINPAHAIGGAITAISGTLLLFARDSARGWASYGSTMWLRSMFLPHSIMKRYQSSDKMAHFYTAGQAGFQTMHVLAFLVGGANKLPDGTIIDHTAHYDKHAARKTPGATISNIQASETLVANEQSLSA